MKKLFILSAILLSFGFVNAQTIWISETKLKGTIGKYEIVMTLAVPYGGATPCFTIGKYYYSSKKRLLIYAQVTMKKSLNELMVMRQAILF